MQERSTESAEPRTLRLGVFGSPGSFSEEAGLAYAQREGLHVSCLHLTKMEAVLLAVREGRADLGVLPVANTIGGLVRASFEAMGKHPFVPVGQISLRIRHCLAVRSADVRTEGLRRVASHPQALAQCNEFLSTNLPGVERLAWSDTASAARDLAQGVLPEDAGVLASERASKAFGLTVLASDVQDTADNRTTFLVLGRLSK